MKLCLELAPLFLLLAASAPAAVLVDSDFGKADRPITGLARVSGGEIGEHSTD